VRDNMNRGVRQMLRTDQLQKGCDHHVLSAADQQQNTNRA
jgi:hypothetical protein